MSNNYGYTDNEMKDNGRWTPVYTPSEPSSQEHQTNHRSTPVNYRMPSDLMQSVQRYHPKTDKPRVPHQSRNHRHVHRQRNPRIPSPADPPTTKPAVQEYNLENSLAENNINEKKEENIMKSRFNIILTRLFQTALLFGFIAYLVAVIIIKSEIEDGDYWCDADGLLIIITVIGTYMFVHFKILKPLLKIVKKSLSKEESERVEIVPSRRWCDHWIFKLIGYGIFLVAVIGFLVYDTVDERRRLYSLAGIIVLIVIAFIFSADRMKIQWENIIWAFGFQFIFGLIVLRWPPGIRFFECLSEKVTVYLSYTDFGSRFIYGDNLIDLGIFAFKAMSVIIFFSLCIQVLYYYGIMQFLVIKIGWLLKMMVGTTACESVSAAGNMFLGQTEAPLLVKPYLNIMTNSELHAIMTGGFATISGSVLAAFISFGVSASHLVTASVMNAPAALGMSKIYRPETEQPKMADKFFKIDRGDQVNALHAALDGVSIAIPLVANICANLLAFIAVMAFIDGVLNWMCLLINLEDGVCSLSNGFGYVFMPVAFVMGVPWSECYYVGQLIGTKVFVNEFVAYVRLAEFMENSVLSKRAEVIVTYALCGFGNISSIGIQIGGLGSLSPLRKPDFARLAVSALVAGCSASFMTACIAGTLISSPYQTMSEEGNFSIVNDTLQSL